MQAIRKMEPAWEKVQGLKFQLSSRVYNLPNGGTKVVPYYSLTKTECLYIATKFNDEAQAKLVLRWEELERHGVFSSMKWGKITEMHKNCYIIMWQIHHINVLYILHIFADSSTIDALLQRSFKVQEPRRGDITKDRV
ncbi:MAG: Rha family transcriptional regulator [Bacteroidaceae bacterium]|nr:Rha family transcriptional regulator [Bacteroidaceae bacterium]